MIEAMIQMTAVGFVAAVLGTVLRRHTPELALLLALCAGLWMLRPAAEGLRAVVAVTEELAQVIARRVKKYYPPVVKQHKGQRCLMIDLDIATHVNAK